MAIGETGSQLQNRARHQHKYYNRPGAIVVGAGADVLLAEALILAGMLRFEQLGTTGEVRVVRARTWDEAVEAARGLAPCAIVTGDVPGAGWPIPIDACGEPIACRRVEDVIASLRERESAGTVVRRAPRWWEPAYQRAVAAWHAFLIAATATPARRHGR